jgi:hypothetical protein
VPFPILGSPQPWSDCLTLELSRRYEREMGAESQSPMMDRFDLRINQFCSDRLKECWGTSPPVLYHYTSANRPPESVRIDAR